MRIKDHYQSLANAGDEGKTSQIPFVYKAYFQPIYHVESQKLAGFEALARKIYADGCIEGPGHFMHDLSAEELHELDMTILADACAFAKISANKGLFISVNTSHETLSQKETCDRIEKLLKEYGIRPEQIKIEILESPFPEDAQSLDTIYSNIKTLSQSGHPVILDDYGVSHSNAERLNTLSEHVSGVKHDAILAREMMINIGTGLRGLLAAELQSLVTVIEGIDNKGKDTLVRAAYRHLQGAEHARPVFLQGFLYSEPLSHESALNLTRSSNEPWPDTDLALA